MHGPSRACRSYARAGVIRTSVHLLQDTKSAKPTCCIVVCCLYAYTSTQHETAVFLPLEAYLETMRPLSEEVAMPAESYPRFRSTASPWRMEETVQRKRCNI